MSSTLEKLQSMNKAMSDGTFGTEQSSQQAPAVQQTQSQSNADPDPDVQQTSTQQAPTKQKQQAPAATQQSQDQGLDKDTPPDPKFLERKKSAPAKQQAAAVAQQQAATAKQEIDDNSFFTHLSKVTGGLIKDKKSWEDHIISHNQLVEEKGKGFEPNYKDARTKWVHELMLKNAGSEPETAMRVLRALQFKPEGKSQKDVLLEAALLDPKFAGQSEAKIAAYVSAKYERDFGVLSKPIEELTPEEHSQRVLAEMELSSSVRDAQASISKVLDEFKATEEQPRQMDERVSKNIATAVKKFQGLKLAFSDNPQENEYLHIPMEGGEEELQRLEQDILNPDAAYNEMLSDFETENGMDWNGLIRESFERKNHKKLQQLTFDHGFKMGQLAQINQDRNATTPKELSQVAKSNGGEQPTSFFDAMEKAFKSQGA